MDRNIECVLSQIELLNVTDPDEDAAQTNQQIRNIQIALKKECSTVKLYRDVFTELNNRSLRDAEFAVKVCVMMKSKTFSTLEAFGLRAKKLFLAALQGNFANAPEMMTTDEDMFDNSITLVSEYYNRANASDRIPLLPLVLGYMKLCISARTVSAAKKLVTQLTLNGPILIDLHVSDLDDVMINVREELLDSNNGAVRICLMLAMDIANNNFCRLEGKYEKFYTNVIETKRYRSGSFSRANGESVDPLALEQPEKLDDDVAISKNIKNTASAVKKLLNLDRSLSGTPNNSHKTRNIKYPKTPEAFSKNMNKADAKKSPLNNYTPLRDALMKCTVKKIESEK